MNSVPNGTRNMPNKVKGLRKLVDKIALDQGFNKYNVTIHPMTSDGANYTAVLYLVTISEEKDQLKLFAKVAKFGEKMREYACINIFDTERFFYTKLVKIYKGIEDQHNVPEVHRLNIPRYYGNSPTFLEETIVLEDLVIKGYRVYDRLKSMDWAYASKAVEEIAKFHALSHAFANENREDFEEAMKLVRYNFDVSNEQQKEIFEKNAKLAISVAKDEHKDSLTQFVSKINPSDYKDYLEPIRRPVLIHGDYRVSNQLHKIDKDGNITIKIVDFQTMQGGSPVLDLLYLIFTGTDEEFRREHYRALIDHYYEQLCAALRRLHIEPDDVYTREEYDQELREKLPFGLTIAILSLPIVTIEAENAPVIDENADVTNFSVENVSEMYPERMRGVINDFVRYGVL